ncbi:MAG: DUF2306 domain-containing protein [Pseudomonadota bacterium]
MATLAPDTVRPRIPAPSIAPDTFEKLLGVGAIVLLAAVLVALARGQAEWSRVPWVIWPHLLTIIVALALTPVMMFRRRGDRRHRSLGTIWVVAMILTALFSFAIRQADGGFSWIHLLSIFTLVQVPWLWWNARRHDVAGHRRGVRGMVTGALLIAGFFTFPFDRLLGHWLFG